MRYTTNFPRFSSKVRHLTEQHKTIQFLRESIVFSKTNTVAYIKNQLRYIERGCESLRGMTELSSCEFDALFRFCSPSFADE